MMYGVVRGVPKLAGKWDMFFVNTCGLSYNQGLYIYLAVLVAVLIWGVYEADRAVQDPKLLGSHRFRISIALSLILMGIPSSGMVSSPLHWRLVSLPSSTYIRDFAHVPSRRYRCRSWLSLWASPPTG